MLPMKQLLSISRRFLGLGSRQAAIPSTSAASAISDEVDPPIADRWSSMLHTCAQAVGHTLFAGAIRASVSDAALGNSAHAFGRSGRDHRRSGSPTKSSLTSVA